MARTFGGVFQFRLTEFAFLTPNLTISYPVVLSSVKSAGS